MRVIVPAAGNGRRLWPLTARLPKCLLRVGGTTIVERLLGQLRDAGVADVVLVLGHQADLLRSHVAGLAHRPAVTFVRNPDYERTNSIVSVWAAMPFLDRELAIVDCDVLVSPELLERVLSAPGEAMAVDVDRPREAIDMAVEVRDGAIWDLSKEMPPERISGDSVPFSRWSAAGAARLGRVLQQMVEGGETDVWYQYAIREVAKDVRIEALPAHAHEWREIDSPDDLAAANAAYGSAALPVGRV